MKRLGAVSICGVDFEIIEGTRHEFVDLDDAYGYIDKVECRIVIRAGLPAKMFRNVLLHEIQHGIWSNSGLAEFTAKPTDDLEHFQETFVQTFTPHLIAALESMKKLRFK